MLLRGFGENGLKDKICLTQHIKDWKVRSSHQRCSVKKVVLRNFAKFKGKHLCQSLFFNKVAGLRPRDSSAGVFL